MELQLLKSHLSTDKLLRNEMYKFVVLVYRSVQRLEAMKESDKRPKTMAALSNVLLPLCNVLYFCDILKVLKKIHKSKCILLYSGPKTSTHFFTRHELLMKMSKHAVRTAQKQNRTLTLAVRGSSVYTSIESQMDHWKEEFRAKKSSKLEHVSSLMSANLLPGSFEPDKLIEKLLNHGLVKIDMGENVTYNLPDDDTVTASFQELATRTAVSWGLKAPLNKGREQGTPMSQIPAVLYLDNMVLNGVMLLKKFDDHKPKTVKALKTALQPILRVLYIVNPKEFLKSVTSKKDVKELKTTRKRTYSEMERRNTKGYKIEFESKILAKTSLVSLVNVLSKIRFTIDKKISEHKRMRKSKRKVTQRPNRKSKKGSIGFQSFLLLEAVAKRARNLNRVLVVSSDDNHRLLKCEEQTNQWVQSMSLEREKAMVNSTVGDANSMETESYNFHKTVKVPISNTDGKAMSGKQMLNKLISLACIPEKLHPSVILKYLENIGYCKFNNNQVFYPRLENIMSHRNFIDGLLLWMPTSGQCVNGFPV